MLKSSMKLRQLTDAIGLYMTDVSLNVNSPAHLSLLYLPFKMITLLVLQISSSLFPSLLTILFFELRCLDRPYSINAGEKSNGSF